tara:strand:+ start:12775 stop:13524 length:750 start_codon:yes stop_codon:yes gene_type:complete
MKILKIFLFFYLLVSSLPASKYDCIIASKKYENIYGIPNNLLVSVALTESGKKIKNGEFISWPWTINKRGEGKFFQNKKSAISYVKKYIKNGKKNIDLGCMQVNYMYHPNAFKNFNDAFDPDKNVQWAAKMINSLHAKFGSWESAIGYYHSYRKKKRKKYSLKVFNTLTSLQKENKFSFIQVIDYKENSEDYKNSIQQQKPLSLVKEKIKKHTDQDKKDNKINVNSDYIIARMEKVNFFRNYFYNNKIN